MKWIRIIIIYRSRLRAIERSLIYVVKTACADYALAFARCLCIRVRKCVLHRIVGRKSWGVEYIVKKNKQKKKGRRKRERESKDERDRKRSLWAIEMLIRFARFLGFFVLFCECRSSAYDLLECVVRLAEER